MSKDLYANSKSFLYFLQRWRMVSRRYFYFRRQQMEQMKGCMNWHSKFPWLHIPRFPKMSRFLLQWLPAYNWFWLMHHLSIWQQKSINLCRHKVLTYFKTQSPNWSKAQLIVGLDNSHSLQATRSFKFPWIHCRFICKQLLTRVHT